jgi:hypothetical protein
MGRNVSFARRGDSSDSDESGGLKVYTARIRSRDVPQLLGPASATR